MTQNKTLAEMIAGANDRPAPLYQQIKQVIISQIDNGHWQPRQRVPSESELVNELNVSRMTINRALRELTHEGYLMRLQGVGTFVAERKAFTPMLEVHNISDEIKSRGHRHTSQVLFLRQEPSSESDALKFELTVGAPLYHSRIVHFEDGIPVQLEDRLVNPQIAPEYLQQDFTQNTPFVYLSQVAPLTAAEHTVEAVSGSPEEQKLLHIAAHEPCLQIQRRTWHRDSVVTCARLLYPGARYKMFGRFQQNG
ncbi:MULTISPECIES: histidine utilization repressor [Brenneria]|uniref:Histidine utilization repressor n=1 Tax=Brenneria nigrifluens DSM 30175 = ATCC 13028 TaxID=1121120 RepID=A0A2U1UFG9_9GAMM|nr:MULTISPECIES: histidine utilization repressor [Brenneria]EHD20000.1 transcriptional regulator, GntR family with UTRA sensor domain [Brenneria sp. EniD312]PWC20393.1 histidine utilization repressor [Brenneria nigrifluens DSM 30175 = ATCC 13028]QCR03239.1 histidine utilization repressor [Brenneria nigrifluens DSM 30175 = ATCC 13028]